MTFPCSGCGACCLSVAPLLPAAPDGSCVHLAPDRRTCRIYETRPDVCRMDRPAQVSEGDWQRVNLDACRALRRLRGIPEL